MFEYICVHAVSLLQRDIMALVDVGIHVAYPILGIIHGFNLSPVYAIYTCTNSSRHGVDVQHRCITIVTIMSRLHTGKTCIYCRCIVPVQLWQMYVMYFTQPNLAYLFCTRVCTSAIINTSQKENWCNHNSLPPHNTMLSQGELLLRPCTATPNHIGGHSHI